MIFQATHPTTHTDPSLGQIMFWLSGRLRLDQKSVILFGVSNRDSASKSRIWTSKSGIGKSQSGFGSQHPRFEGPNPRFGMQSMNVDPNSLQFFDGYANSCGFSLSSYLGMLWCLFVPDIYTPGADPKILKVQIEFETQLQALVPFFVSQTCI